MRYSLVLLLFLACSQKESSVAQPEPPPPKIDGTWRRTVPDTLLTIFVYQDNQGALHGTGTYGGNCELLQSLSGNISNPNISLTIAMHSYCYNRDYTISFVGIMYQDSIKGVALSQNWVWVRQ